MAEEFIMTQEGYDEAKERERKSTRLNSSHTS